MSNQKTSKTSVLLVAALQSWSCGERDSSGDPGDSEDHRDAGLVETDAGCNTPECFNFCPSGTMTTLRGQVLAPNGIDPIPSALVYVPRGDIPEPSAQVSCELCQSYVNSAAVSTVTAVDGTFTLGPIPTAEGQAPGETITIVAQKGRFRKVSEVVIEAPCGDNVTESSQTRLPSRSAGLDRVPKIAVATGDYDVMECVLLDIGLDPDAFDLYNGISYSRYNQGTCCETPNTEGSLADLLGDADLMKTYNVIIINCAANDHEALLSDATIRESIEDYVASGGRLYVTDWSYDYIEQITNFSPLIDFGPDASGSGPEEPNAAQTGNGGIWTEALVHDEEMADWLRAVEAANTEEIIDEDGRVRIDHFSGNWAMQYAVNANSNAKVWLSGNVVGQSLSGDLPLTTTFDYLQCGRVMFSSHHTMGRRRINGPAFPDYCESEFAPQERLLMYLIMHVADCIQID